MNTHVSLYYKYTLLFFVFLRRLDVVIKTATALQEYESTPAALPDVMEIITRHYSLWALLYIGSTVSSRHFAEPEKLEEPETENAMPTSKTQTDLPAVGSKLTTTSRRARAAAAHTVGRLAQRVDARTQTVREIASSCERARAFERVAERARGAVAQILATTHRAYPHSTYTESE